MVNKIILFHRLSSRLRPLIYFKCEDIHFTTRLNENFGYSKDEANFILTKINHPTPESVQIVGDGNLKKLDVYKTKNGEFSTLEDLLKVHGLGLKSMKRICDKLVKFRSSGETAKTSLPRKIKLAVATPSLSYEQASLIKSVGAIQINTNYVSWAVVNCISKNLMYWNSFSLEKFISSKKKPDLIVLISIADEVARSLPECDTYLFEDCSAGPMTSSNCAKQLLTAAIGALLFKPSGDVPKVVAVSGKVVNRWSGCQVGTERVSSQSLIAELILKLPGGSIISDTRLPTVSKLYAEPQLRSMYSSSPSHVKEVLADAVLLAMAFLDLALINPPSEAS